MRLHILGKNKDDVGTQLELLTKELLESLGYQRIRMNVANDAGEVDIDCEYVTPLPINPRVTRVIAECKAHRAPLNMTDWLKFLGKVYVATLAGDDVAGCLIALSGVNGNVLGSYEAVKERNIRLIDSTTLTEYLTKSHNLVPLTDLLNFLANSQKTYISIAFAYYQRKVYWLIFYENGEYTLLGADASHLSIEILDCVRPMVERCLDTNKFVDLREEESAYRKHLMARKFVITALMLGDGHSTIQEVLSLSQPHLKVAATEAEYCAAASELAQESLIEYNSETLGVNFTDSVQTNPRLLQRIFIEFGREGFVSLALGCKWWNEHINEALLKIACKTQGNLNLGKHDRERAVYILQLSPNALLYALVPDPMIVTHRMMQPRAEEHAEMLIHDRTQFMRSIYKAMSEDFKLRMLAGYFHQKRRIEAVSFKTNIRILNREGESELEDNYYETTAIGEWHQTSPNGDPQYVHLSAILDYEKRRQEIAAKKLID